MANSAVDVFSKGSIEGYLATAILTVLGLLITVFILKLLLYKPIMKIVNERQNQINQLIEETEKNHASSIEKQRQLDVALADARVEAGALLAKAKEQGERQFDTIVSDAKKEASSILEKAQKEREQMLADDKERIYSEAVNLAVAAVGNMAAQRYTSDGEWQKMRDVLTDYVAQTQTKDVHKSDS